jgi:glycosyltransferase involved in cell wall biosynthesis
VRVAVVHEWLTVIAGSERVLDEILALYPEADLFALVCAVDGEPPSTYRGRRVRTSFVQRLPFVPHHFRRWLPLFPRAVESFDLSGYDLVISSSHCVAKGAVTRRDALHVSYCYSPVRYAWDLRDQYLEESGLTGVRGWVARRMLDRLRRWDARTASRVDQFVTLSHHIAERISRCYGRESTVVYPPVDLDAFPLATRPRSGFVAASRLVPYKLMPLIIRAFAAMPDLSLTVIGDGPDQAACEHAANGHSNIRLLPYEQSVLCTELQRAEAFVFAALEDFGIAPLEAQACGTPVIAYGKGGAAETIRSGVTGLFFDEQSERAITDAVRRFRAAPAFAPEVCRANAERFTASAFRAGFRAAVADAQRTPRS